MIPSLQERCLREILPNWEQYQSNKIFQDTSIQLLRTLGEADNIQNPVKK